jgi:hypothetical protein
VVDRKTVEIAVDSRGVVAGLKEADKAFDQTARKADKAEKEVKQVGQTSHEAGRNMSAAFAATGGGLAITHGLEGIATGFRSGNSAMSAFAASQALLDLGRFAEDMKGVTQAAGGATSIFGTLGAVMKAHPLMTIATVLAGAAAAMAIFSDDTGEAADEFDRLAESMEKVRISRQAAELLGVSQLSAAQRQQQGVRGAAEAFVTGGATYGGMAGALGVPMQELLRLQQVGGAALPTEPVFRRVGGAGQFGASRMEEVPFAEQQVTREAAQAILRTLYRQLESETKQLQAKGGTAAGAGAALGGPGFDIFAVGQAGGAFARDGTVYPAGFGTGQALMRQPGMPGTFGYQPAALTGGAAPGTGMLGFGMDRMMQASLALADYQREQADLAKQRMDELVALGEDFGATIGDAFFRVAEGTATARQAAAELVRMFAQMASTGIFRQIGKSIGSAFAPTPTQETANAAPAPTSMGP